MQALEFFQTTRDVLRYAVTRFNKARLFFGHGVQNAFDEAAYLILHTLHLPLDQLDPFLDARLLPQEITAVLEVIEKRCQTRLPAAYLTNEAWLGDYRFYIDQRVIVPRSLLAELIPEQFMPWLQDPAQVTHILELCTGSGCLAILLADAFPNATVDAVDISTDALAVAERNVQDYELTEWIHLIESDLYDQLPKRRYDLIISNPPYVNQQSMQRLPPEYQHEPALALAGGNDGMDIVRRILQQASAHLTEHGVLIVEIGNEYKHVITAFSELSLVWLACSAGDHSIFLISAEQLKSFK